jgi:hypothetical protein
MFKPCDTEGSMQGYWAHSSGLTLGPRASNGQAGDIWRSEREMAGQALVAGPKNAQKGRLTGENKKVVSGLV